MQNSAEWVSTTPEGYRVRVRFLPMNAAETERMRRLLKNFTVQTVMATTEGPLSVDLFFTDKVEIPTPAPVAAPVAAPVGTMVVNVAEWKSDPKSVVDKINTLIGDVNSGTFALQPSAADLDAISSKAQTKDLTAEQQAAMDKPASKA